MMKLISRSNQEQIENHLRIFPAVGILGPRQVGKSTLARQISEKANKKVLFLDLELPEDVNRLANPVLLLEQYTDHLVIIDETQRMPELFPILRVLIDRNRLPGRFILLGSASPAIIKGSSESLAGRIAYSELKPFNVYEKTGVPTTTHWVRGGFPEALLAINDQDAALWLNNFVRTYLERDLPMMGFTASPLMARRLWTMLAHSNGQVINYENLSKSLGISAVTVKSYIYFLESAYMVRSLHPWASNLKKRMVKSPKVYVRDTGILHSLFGINTINDLLGHPAAGASWETFAIENILGLFNDQYEAYFYRTYDGTEADLVISSGNQVKYIFEIKLNARPNITRSLRSVMDDLQPEKTIIISPIEGAPYPIDQGVWVSNLNGLVVVIS